MSHLSHLHGVWNTILAFISSKDILKLHSTGDLALQSILYREVDHLTYAPSQGYLDVLNMVASASRWPNLSSLSILAAATHIIALAPFNFAALRASKIESLSLRFYGCVPAVLKHSDLHNALPHLKTLNLSGDVDIQFGLRRAKYPPNLTSLSLEAHTGAAKLFEIQKGDIANMPRTLTELSLKHIYCEEPFTIDEFPPSLTSLSLHVMAPKNIVIESLPRNLTRVHLYGSCILKSSPASQIPWRAYFPQAVELTAAGLLDNHWILLLDASAIISDPRLEDFRKTLWPSRTGDSDEAKGASTLDLDLSKAAETRYTHLSFVQRPTYPFMPMPSSSSEDKSYSDGLLTRLTSLESLMCPLTPAPDGIQHWKFLTSLHCKSIALHQIPPTLKALLINEILVTAVSSTPTIPGTAASSSHDSIYFPCRRLTHLSVTRPLPLDIIMQIPDTIEELRLCFSGSVPLPSNVTQFDSNMRSVLVPEGVEIGSLGENGHPITVWDKPEWTTNCDKGMRFIATRLVNLKDLTICDMHDFPSTCLTPFASQVFNSLQLSNQGGVEPFVPFWLSVVFDDRNVSGRPLVFPPSFKKMTLRMSLSQPPISILAMLPKTLTYFSTLGLSVTQYVLPNLPIDETYDLEKLFALLPLQMRHLSWKKILGHWTDTSVTPLECNAEALSSLPQSLQYLELGADSMLRFILSDAPTYEENKIAHCDLLIKHLPPHLSFLLYQGEEVCFERYINEPSKKLLTDQTLRDMARKDFCTM